MVGARLVEDSSIVASGAWSSDGSAFFIRELGPRTKARPETRSGKHRSFICSPPCVNPQHNSHFHLRTRRQQGLCAKPWLSQHSCCPPSWGGGNEGLGWRGERREVLNELAVLPPGGSPRMLSLKQQSGQFKSGYSRGRKCNKCELVGLTTEGFPEEVRCE